MQPQDSPHNRLPVTAIIPVYNEADHIRDVIESVLWADEILIVDSFSTDETLDIARTFPVKIIQREYQNSASQKNWAIPQAAHDWIILVDADERVTPALRDEILGVLSGTPQADAYWIWRINHFMGKRIRFSGWQGDKVIRLFRKSLCHYEHKHVHAEVVCSGTVGKLKNKFLHYSYKSMEHYMEKQRRYADWSARDRDKRTGKITWFHTVFKPGWRIFNHFILQGGFMDGRRGWIIARVMAYGVWLRYQIMKKLRAERQQGTTA